MKKIHLITVAILLLVGWMSCDETAENPGNFSLKSELEVVEVYDTLGNKYPISVMRTTDTTYQYPRIKLDTLKDNSGKPILDAYNKLQITRDTTYYAGKKTAKFVVLNPIVIAAPKGELRIDLVSNARWQAPSPDFKGKIPWFLTQTANGGGSSTITVKISAGLSKSRRPVLATQYIFTRDSMVLYKLTVDQKAQNEQ